MIGRDLANEPFKTPSGGQDLCPLRPTLRVAQALGALLDGGPLLLPALPGALSPALTTEVSDPW